MGGKQSPLTRQEREAAFRQATRCLIAWYGDELEKGVTDERLKALLENALGIFGGSCGPGRLHVTHQGAGLKIWASRTVHNHCQMKPVFAGQETVRMAREVYRIPDPFEAQLPLL